jgi:hypothetical protein
MGSRYADPLSLETLGAVQAILDSEFTILVLGNDSQGERGKGLLILRLVRKPSEESAKMLEIHFTT